jgi:hypothetical protein
VRVRAADGPRRRICGLGSSRNCGRRRSSGRRRGSAPILASPPLAPYRAVGSGPADLRHPPSTGSSSGSKGSSGRLPFRLGFRPRGRGER